jgi:peptidoglycan/LPS O-acetylase OafA/YrhL
VAKLGMFMAAERPDFAVYASLIGRMDQFLIGMLAASLAQRHHDRLAAHARWLLPLAALATYGGLVVLARHGSMFGPPRQWLWLAWPTVEALLWSAVIVLYVVRPPAWPAWLDRLLQRGGEISYSLYMLHLLVIFILFRSLGLMPLTGLPWLDLALNAVPVALLTWTLAATSFAVIERPFLRMRGRYLH